jgi:PhzF family phenazine biosynthesis protein
MRIRVVDAFTDQPFAGNPAGVCLLAAGPWPDETWMRSLAAEMKHAETAFARPSDSADADWDLRWFTPAVEAQLCGHATLATTHAMAADGLVDGKVRFSTLSGILTTEVGPDGAITLDFPAALPIAAEPPAGLVDALGVEPVVVYRAEGLGDLLFVLPDEKAVRAIAPDLGAVGQITARDEIRGVIVTAAAEDPDAGYDFVSRFFAPAYGIPEDPVTGSAHTALAPYWAARLGRDHLVGFQASARGGLVHVVPDGDRVRLTGRAVTVLDGTLADEVRPRSRHE